MYEPMKVSKEDLEFLFDHFARDEVDDAEEIFGFDIAEICRLALIGLDMERRMSKMVQGMMSRGSSDEVDNDTHSR
jgi:hypothetical protein